MRLFISKCVAHWLIENYRPPDSSTQQRALVMMKFSSVSRREQLPSRLVKKRSIVFDSCSLFGQGFAKGSTVAAVGPVKISWHNAQQSQTKPQGVTAPSSQPAITKDVHPDDTRSTSPSPGRRPSPRPQEEEVVASGWGDGDEDGMGMF